jgi:hypothetical protein
LHDVLGVALAERGEFDGIMEFRQALRLESDSAETHRDLGAALATLTTTFPVR